MRQRVSVTLRYTESKFNTRNVTKIYRHVTAVNSGYLTGTVIVAGVTPLAVALS